MMYSNKYENQVEYHKRGSDYRQLHLTSENLIHLRKPHSLILIQFVSHRYVHHLLSSIQHRQIDPYQWRQYREFHRVHHLYLKVRITNNSTEHFHRCLMEAKLMNHSDDDRYELYSHRN